MAGASLALIDASSDSKYRNASRAGVRLKLGSELASAEPSLAAGSAIAQTRNGSRNAA